MSVEGISFLAQVVLCIPFYNSLAHMEKRGVSVRQGTHAVHTLGYYQRKYGLRDEDFPVSFMADRLSITLPLYVGIGMEEQERVISTLREEIRSS